DGGGREGGEEGGEVAAGVVEAGRSAHGVIICPANPITAIAPSLAVPGLQAALSETGATAIAISPIVGSDAVSGPAGRLMAISGVPGSAAGVARAHASWPPVLPFRRRAKGPEPPRRAPRAAPGPLPHDHGSQGRRVSPR